MLIIIYGEDTYRSREWLRELELNFKKKFDPQGYNLLKFSGDHDWGEIRSSIVSPPFLCAKRMVVIERLFEKSGKNENIEETLSKTPESTIVIVWEEGDEKSFAKKPLFAKLVRNKTIKFYSYPMLRSAELANWVKDRAKQKGISFAPGAFQIFLGRAGSDLWRISGELEKLGARKQSITEEIINELVQGSVEENIFAFVDAVSLRDSKKAIKELRAMKESDADFPYLISMLGRQFRLMLQANDYLKINPKARSADLVNVFGWHSFVAGKVLAQAAKFDDRRARESLDAVFLADKKIKSGAIDPDSAIDLLVTNLVLK